MTEVKRYQRQKILALVLNTLLSLGWLAILGLVLGPRLGALYTEWFDGHEALRLLASAVILGISLEALTLPLAFWSGYVLEHRFQLSNQTLGGWLGRRIKGYLVG